MDEPLEKRLRFLREAHTESMPHSERGLLDHLLGTRALLVEWGARPAVCDASLFHSVYGTEHYELTVIPLSLRADVQHLIGEESEALAWLFCIMHRESFDQNLLRTGAYSIQHRLTAEKVPLTAAQFHDLVTMTFANTLEAFPRLPWGVRRNCRAYLRPFRTVAISGAQNAFDQVEAQWWEFWK
jgi:(p)ppGpp synthase/HD superfamily hydrolase